MNDYYKLIVRGNNYTRGIWCFKSEGQAFKEKRRWEAKGFHCVVERS